MNIVEKRNQYLDEVKAIQQEVAFEVNAYANQLKQEMDTKVEQFKSVRINEVSSRLANLNTRIEVLNDILNEESDNYKTDSTVEQPAEDIPEVVETIETVESETPVEEQNELLKTIQNDLHFDDVATKPVSDRPGMAHILFPNR